jgi:hypothetical protein
VPSLTSFVSEQNSLLMRCDRMYPDTTRPSSTLSGGEVERSEIGALFGEGTPSLWNDDDNDAGKEEDDIGGVDDTTLP